MQPMKTFKNILKKILLFLTITISFSLITLDTMDARPGGGSSYRSSGGSSSRSYSGGGSSGYSGGGGGGVGFPIPIELAIPIFIIYIVYTIVKKRREAGQNVTFTGSSTPEIRSMKAQQIDASIGQYKATADPNFSRVLFLDFVGSLYNKYYSFRGSKDLNLLAPFFAKQVMVEAQSPKYQSLKTSEIVVGNIKISDFSVSGNRDAITVDMDANYTIVNQDKATRYVIYERWLLVRNKGVKSQDPEKMRTISCPNCGSPANFTDGGECQACGTVLQGGEMQWMVQMRKILRQETFKTNFLASYSQEVGTDFPTVKQAGLGRIIQQFEQKHGVDWDSFFDNFRREVAKPIFMKMYDVWSRNRFHLARHMVSDRLYESYSFWMDAYKRAGYANKLEDIEVSLIELAKIESDKFYESLTVRVFASCYDYVVDRGGKTVAGSDRKKRAFSEYWTFIRRAGLEIKQDNTGWDLNTCPNCGAPADKMGQAAECGYCGAKVSTGDFSWILAIVIQDEVYEG